MNDNLHVFKLEQGEIIHIHGIPYRHTGNGWLEGATDPKVAREAGVRLTRSKPMSEGA